MSLDGSRPIFIHQSTYLIDLRFRQLDSIECLVGNVILDFIDIQRVVPIGVVLLPNLVDFLIDFVILPVKLRRLYLV